MGREKGAMTGKVKRCEACGTEFQCFAECTEAERAACWCASVPLSAESRDRLRTQFQDCLCEDCLRKADQKI